MSEFQRAVDPASSHPAARGAERGPFPAVWRRRATDRVAANEAGRSASPMLWQQVLDEIDHGLMLVTETGALCFANRQALRTCAAMGCMDFSAGLLQAVDPCNRPALRKALDLACRGHRAMLRLRHGQHSISVAAVPLMNEPPIPVPPDSLQTTAAPRMAMLQLSRPQACQTLSLEFFAREHRVTLAECNVLRGLCEGLTPAVIAQRSGVALSTVRTQISSMRQKVGAPTIGDLVRRISLLPPIMGLMN